MIEGICSDLTALEPSREGKRSASHSLGDQKPLKGDIDGTRHLPALPKRSQLCVGEPSRLTASIGSDGVELVKRRHDEKISKVVFGFAVGADI